MSPQVSAIAPVATSNSPARVVPIHYAGTLEPHLSPDDQPVVCIVRSSWYAKRGKRLLDLLLALVLIVISLPVILLCAILVRLTSRGPAIYSQTRLGLDGKPFRIYKLRSMQHNCEQVSGARWATRRDARVTGIGKFLRTTHLDELLQLWNVIKGDMSLVGPRPERPEFIPTLEAAIPGYRIRMSVLPGVTGLAQVYLSPDTSLDSVRRKLAFDREYLRQISLWLDLRLMVATVLQAVGIPCFIVRFILWLPSIDSIEHPLPEEANPQLGHA